MVLLCNGIFAVGKYVMSTAVGEIRSESDYNGDEKKYNDLRTSVVI